jgi:DNA-binding response OmpR family regulator
MTASPHAAEPLLNQGMVGYLAKPFDIDQLLECVKRYLRGDDEANASSNPSSHTRQV